MTTKLIILDRDGVINYDSANFIRSASEWVPLPGSLNAISRLKAEGWVVAVATNQSGIGRGYFTEEALYSMHAKFQKLLEEQFSCSVDLIVYCPHIAEEGCACRKPRPGMYLDIASYFGAELTSVPVVGDSWRDIQAAISVGCNPILVETGKGKTTLSEGHDFNNVQVCSNLSSAVDSLLKGASSA